MGGNYIQFVIDRDQIAATACGLAKSRKVLEVALGGMPLTTTVEGLEPLRREFSATAGIFSRKSGGAAEIIVPTPTGAQCRSVNWPKSRSSARGWESRAKAPCPNAWDLRGREEHRHRHLRSDGDARPSAREFPKGRSRCRAATHILEAANTST